MNHEELNAARLLCDNPGLSVIERERILENILGADDVGPEEEEEEAKTPGRLLRFPSLVATSLAAAAALVLFIKQPSTDEFTARSGVSGPRLEVLCEPGPVCRPGAGLAFRISEAPAECYAIAFARGQEGTVIWYLPEPGSETGTRIADDEWLELGVRLGSEHPPGEYSVRAFLSPNPLTREDVRRFVKTGQGSDITELTTTFEVHP